MNDTDDGDPVPLATAKLTLVRRLTLTFEHSRAARARLEEARTRSRLLDALFGVIERDSDIGGGILAGALAYRLFLFFLPLAFLLVAALGLVSRWFDVSPYLVGRDVGVVSLVTREVAASAENGVGWWVAIVALVALAYLVSVLWRAVAIVHALAWQRSAAAAKPSRRSIRVFVLGIAAELVLTAITGPSRPPTGLIDVLVLTCYVAGSAAIWLAISLRLPHANASWHHLVPGACLYGVGLLLVHLFNVYILERLLESRSSTYGALGAAGAVLLGFFLLARLIVASAVVNATLFERRTGSDS